MKPIDWLTLSVALYGAILSTVIFWRERQKERRTLLISCRVSIGIDSRSTTGRYISIEAVNIGHRPITLTQAGLLSSANEIFVSLVSDPVFYPIPKKLEDGEMITVHMSWEDVINAAKERKIYFTKAFVQDAEGKKYLTRLPVALRELGIAK
jgi:hypothetical protein